MAGMLKNITSFCIVRIEDSGFDFRHRKKGTVEAIKIFVVFNWIAKEKHTMRWDNSISIASTNIVTELVIIYNLTIE